MIKRAFCFLLILLTLSSIITTANSPFIPTPNLTLSNFTYISDMQKQINEFTAQEEKAFFVGKYALSLGYDSDSYILQGILQEISEIQQNKIILSKQLLYWEEKFEEYPYSTYIWLYLTDTLNYTAPVAAGILGNIMAEVGGNTLDIQYWLYSYGNNYYYGICQWSKDTYPSVRGTDLIFQCDFLNKTIEYELNTFGYTYKKDYKYTDFLALTSVSEAALMFAQGYERCAKSTYLVRQKNAIKAYNYFMGLY